MRVETMAMCGKVWRDGNGICGIQVSLVLCRMGVLIQNRWIDRPLHLQEPPRVRASRSITLPSRISQPQPQPQNISVTQTTHQPNHDNTPPKKLTFLRSLFPLSTITTVVPTTPFPTPTTPPFTSPLSPSPHERAHEKGKETGKREKFDVDKGG